MFITKSYHERQISVWRTDLKRANEARDNWRDSSKEWEAKFKKAVADLAALDVTDWSSHFGGPPDGDSPLLCVYDAGIGYAYDRLAEWLGVADYEMGDGSEDYATDVGRTGANVLVAAGFVNDDGDLLSAAEMAALKADALLWRNARDKRAKNRGGGK